MTTKIEHIYKTDWSLTVIFAAGGFVAGMLMGMSVQDADAQALPLCTPATAGAHLCTPNGEPLPGQPCNYTGAKWRRDEQSANPYFKWECLKDNGDTAYPADEPGEYSFPSPTPSPAYPGFVPSSVLDDALNKIAELQALKVLAESQRDGCYAWGADMLSKVQTWK